MSEVRHLIKDLGRRMLGAARLDPAPFQGIAEDRSAAYQALFVVLLVGLIGGVVGVPGGSPGLFNYPILFSIWMGIPLQVASWLIWSGVTYVVASSLMYRDSARPELESVLRFAGIAQTPGILLVFVVIPENPFLIAWTATGWRVAAMAVATRVAFGFETNGRPAVASVCGFVCGFLLMLALSYLMVYFLIDRIGG